MGYHVMYNVFLIFLFYRKLSTDSVSMRLIVPGIWFKRNIHIFPNPAQCSYAVADVWKDLSFFLCTGLTDDFHRI